MKKNNTVKENLNLVQYFVDIVNKDDLTELQYETDSFKIKIVKHGININNNIQEKVIQSSKNIDIDVTAKTEKKETEKFTNEHPGAVNSPMVGTAYCSPEPGKEPFIKLNKSVSKGDTLLIIEAMKVMNTITAHKSGKVVFIGFEDNQPIEYNQLLLIIE